MRLKNFPSPCPFARPRVSANLLLMEILRAADMLKMMDSWITSGERVPFSIEFVTCDLKKNTGGQKISIEKAVMVGSARNNGGLKNPNHFENYTRNIRSVDSDQIIKVHVLLVTKFNGKAITI